MRARAAVVALAVGLLAVAGCGDDGDGAAAEGDPAGALADAGDENGGDADPAAELPEACPAELPYEIELVSEASLPGVVDGTFEAVSAVAVAQPLLPGEDDLGFEEARQRAAETDLLSYSVYLADGPLADADVSGLAITPPEGATLLGFSVVPPTETPLAIGDVVPGGRPDYDSITTLANLGVSIRTDVTDDAPAFATDGESGEAEILHLDEDWICLRYEQEGSVFGGADNGATWSVDVVVAGPIVARNDLAFS